MLKKITKGVVCLIVAGMICGWTAGCESGDKVIDQATGKETLDQYKETKDKLKALDEKQKERLQNMPGQEKQEDK